MGTIIPILPGLHIHDIPVFDAFVAKLQGRSGYTCERPPDPITMDTGRTRFAANAGGFALSKPWKPQKHMHRR